MNNAVTYYFPDSVGLEPVSMRDITHLPLVGEKVRFSTFCPRKFAFPMSDYGKLAERWFVVRERFFVGTVPGNPMEAMNPMAQPIQHVWVYLELEPEVDPAASSKQRPGSIA